MLAILLGAQTVIIAVLLLALWRIVYSPKSTEPVAAKPTKPARTCYGEDQFSKHHAWGPYQQKEYLGTHRNGVKYQVTRNVKKCTVCHLEAKS